MLCMTLTACESRPPLGGGFWACVQFVGLAFALLSVSGCTSLTRLEETLSSRETPTYLVISGDPGLVPGAATVLLARPAPLAYGDSLSLTSCELTPISGYPISGYESATLSGGPLFTGIFWNLWAKEQPMSGDSVLMATLKDQFNLVNNIRLRFRNSLLVRLDESETFVAFIARHPDISISDTVKLLAPCRLEISKKNYRIISHLITAEVEIEFQFLAFRRHLRASDVTSESRTVFMRHGLVLDETKGTLVSTRPMVIARYGQYLLNSVGRFGPASPSRDLGESP